MYTVVYCLIAQGYAGRIFNAGDAGGRPSQCSVSPKALPLHPPPSWARKPVLHLRCVTQLTLVCILRYSGCSSLPIQSSVCYDIQNGSLCRSSFLYATLFQNASLCLSGVLYATLFKMLPFTYLIHIHYKKLHTTRTGRHSARFRPSAGLFSPFRSECTAEAQDTGWLCFCRRGALLRWRESALFFKSSLFERSEFGLLENGFSRFSASQKPAPDEAADRTVS